MHRSASLGVIIGVVAALALASPKAGAVSSGSSSSSAPAGSSDWKNAKRAIAAKDYDAAVPLLKKVVANDPSGGDASTVNLSGHCQGDHLGLLQRCV